MTEDIVECYCDDEEDDGTMMFCEKCHKWQHAVCVNWNDFTAPQTYICPTCQGIQIECICNTESDYQHAVIQCSKCHLYQHKRHVGFGIGKNPPNYICSKCSSTYVGGRNLKIEPILKQNFFPSFNEKIIPQNINKFSYQIPTGRFNSKVREFSQGSPITPVYLTCSMIVTFRDILFKSHPTLKYFDYVKYYPDRNIKDACQFMFYLIKTLSFLCELSMQEIMQISDHIVSLMIYKNALPVSFRYPVTNDAEDEDLVVGLSDRAQDITRSNYKLTYFPRPRENIPLRIVAGRNAFPTVISLVDVRECDFICRIWGYCMDYEEIDQQNQVPDFSIYNVARSKLFINSSKVKGHPIFSHIRRGLVSNCEVRLFKTTLRGSKKKVICAGIFATRPTLMQHLIDAKPTVDSLYINNSTMKTSNSFDNSTKIESEGDDDSTNDEHQTENSKNRNDEYEYVDSESTSKSKKGNKDKYVIFAGEELVLPFDLAPIFIRNDAEWRNGPVDPRLVDIDKEFDINLVKPMKPANSNATQEDEANSFAGNLSEKIALEQQYSQMNAIIEVEPKEVKENETTMQYLFSKDEPFPLNFIIEPSQKKSAKNKSQKDEESSLNSDSEDSFQITSKSDIQNFLKKEGKGNLIDTKIDGNNEAASSSLIPKKKKLHPSLAPSDPLQGKKSWYQPVEFEEKSQELNLEFRDQWNPISPAVTFKKKTKQQVTPAEFWAEDPVDFVDVSDSDLK